MNTEIVGTIAFILGVSMMIISPFVGRGLLLTGCIVMGCGWVLMVKGVADLGAGVETS